MKPKPKPECTKHHFACDCREAMFAEAMLTQRRVIDWQNQSDEGLRLRCGELTAQEIRTIRAVLSVILPNVRDPGSAPSANSAEGRKQPNEN